MTNRTNGFAGAGPSKALDPKQAFAQAEGLMRERRYGEAEAIFRRLLSAHPAHPAVLNGLAMVLRAKGDAAEAETLLRQAVAAAPSEPGYHTNLANLLMRRQAFTDAEAEYRAALALDPNNADAHYNHALSLEQLGLADEAIKSLDYALRIREDHRALTRVGVILRKQGRLEEALNWYDRAIAAKPDFFDAHYHRGDVLFILSRPKEAAAAQRRALELRPDSFEAHFALANALASAGNDDERALASFWRATELRPDFADAHYGYSQLAWTMGRKDAYRSSYARARAIAKPNPELLLQEARMLMPYREYAEAEKLLRLAYETAPERADVAASLGEILTAAQRWDDAHTLFERAIQLDPKSVPYRRALAIMLLRTDEARAARKALEDARELDPADQETLALLALAYRQAGDETAFQYLMDFGKYVRVFDVALPAGFADATSFNNALAEELERLHTRKVELFDQTLRGGSQTMGNLFSGPTRAVGLVRDSIRDAVAQYIGDLPDDPSHPMARRREGEFSFSGSWSCRLSSSGYHTNHVHPKGWISSAYYVHLPDAVEDEASRQGWLKFGESNFGLGARDTPMRHERPAVGRLVLFPSYFWHGTVPFQSSDNRLTVAFDVVPGNVPPAPTRTTY